MPVDDVNDVDGWVISTRHRFESVLQKQFEGLVGPSPMLNQAAQYALLDGGKRLRALLVYAAGQAVGVSLELLDDAACAIEAMHAYSLVHDDLPCMDNDVLRRGKPTCHVQFGEANALLAGDALQTLAFHLLARSQHGGAEVRLAQIAALASASGLLGMAAGQAIDLAHVGQSMTLEALMEMHARKTGDLIAASIRMGYLAQTGVQPEQSHALDALAKVLGLAYQVKDDILDVEACSDMLGKTTGKDALNNKPTVVSLLGLPKAKAWLQALQHEALDCLELLEPSGRRCLERLVDLVMNRSA